MFFLHCNSQLEIGNWHFSHGVLAQLVERLNGIEEVRGSNPLGSRISEKILEHLALRIPPEGSSFFGSQPQSLKVRSLLEEACLFALASHLRPFQSWAETGTLSVK